MNKYFSRSGATTQRNINFRVALLRRCVRIFVLLSLTSIIFAQRGRFDPNGSNWLKEGTTTPTEFSDFSAINLNAKRSRRLPSPGLQLNNGSTYRFKTLSVKRDNFTFTTMT